MALSGYESLVKTVGVGDIAADSDAIKYAVMVVPSGRRFKVTGAYLSAKTDVAAADTNYNTFYLRNNSLTANAILTLANGPAATGTDITQTPVAMGSLSEANQEVGSDSADTTIFLTVTKTGTGAAVTGMAVHIAGEWIK